MTRKSVLSLGTIMAVAALAACSDSPVAPAAPLQVLKAPSLAVFDPNNPPAPELGSIVVCKSGNIGGTFNLSTIVVTNDVDGAATPSSVGVTNGNCEVVSTDASGSGSGKRVTVVEGAAADPVNTVQTFVSCQIITQEVDSPTTTIGSCSLDQNTQRFINSYHGYVLVYDNVYTPPPPPTGCTYTKGWYRNNGAETITGVDGLTTTVEGAIFAATPGKPGSVTWTGGGNDVLNLYQQLLAALENGGDASGIAAVEQAISDAQGLTSVNGYQITYSGTKAQLSSLINTLSAFNEGSYEGWPHCG